MQKYKILSLKDRRDIADIIFIIKLLKSEINCSELLTQIEFRNNIKNIRNQNIFKLKIYPNNEAENCPLNRCMKLINKYSSSPYNIDFLSGSVTVNSIRIKLQTLFENHQEARPNT
ncbi:hypothetical protein WDU94_013299 [Cyamophila willieti]